MSCASSETASTDVHLCVTVTLADGLVLAWSVFEHSQRHDLRTVRLVTDPVEKLAGLRFLTEHVAPGQWDDARQPSRKELAAARLLALPLAEPSVRVRADQPDDGHSPDAALGLWELAAPTRDRSLHRSSRRSPATA
jgi:uncharacterized protein